MSDITALADYFGVYWKNEASSAGSPLYAALCDVVAGSSRLLRLAAESQAGQPAPNMLFAAVHALLAEHPDDPLGEYYLSVGGTKLPDEELGVRFEEFCTRWSEPILEILHTRLVQTNEVRRSAFLLPALSFAWRGADRRPLALIELGPSAGLNLLFDQYSYLYGGTLKAGDPASTVEIDADTRGSLSAVHVELPPVAFRTGIDLNPLDVCTASDARWLAALTFPEHEDRRRLLASAIGVARASDVSLMSGDAVALLPRVLAEVPPGLTPCVIASFVLHQLDQEQRLQLRRVLEEESRKRPFYIITAGYSDFLGWEGHQPDSSTFVKVGRLEDGRVRVRTLVHCHPHGRWLEYLHDRDWETPPG